jgi:shikimate dehydrogenase
MKSFGLIGYPLEHSFSEGYFAEKFYKEQIKGCRYTAYPIEDIKLLPKLLEEEQLIGFNVTIPYKEAVIDYLDELSPAAQAIGAVNTVHIKDGKRIGHNTDYLGFQQSLCQQHEKALILGTGGAAKAIVYALEEMGTTVSLVSRKNGDLLYEELTEAVFKEHSLIVNCTPLGTYPEVHQLPSLPYEHIGTQHLLYDLVYNPAKTAFLLRGEQQGASIQNGLQMLHAQAELAWNIWTK